MVGDNESVPKLSDLLFQQNGKLQKTNAEILSEKTLVLQRILNLFTYVIFPLLICFFFTVDKIQQFLKT